VPAVTENRLKAIGRFAGLFRVGSADSESVGELLEEGERVRGRRSDGVEDAGTLMGRKLAGMRCRRMIFPANIGTKSKHGPRFRSCLLRT